MKILIDGTGIYNKGAELLLLSVLEILKNDTTGSENQFYFGRGVITKKRLKELDMQMHNTPKNLKLLFYNLPFVKIPQKYEVDIVLDASGFRYGDFWVTKRTLYFNFKEYLKYRFLKKIDAKIVFLPQAFGAFNNIKSKLSAKTIVKFADLIIARDKKSFDYINSFVKNTSNAVQLYPDFTNLLVIPENNSYEPGICVIPNSKILEKYNDKDSQTYLDFLVKSIDFFLKRNKKVYILNHSSKYDLPLCKNLLKIINDERVELIHLEDPLAIKGLLKKSEFVIASRFHGIISSLSQGVPTICIGWSHKYEYLMSDYNQSDALIDITTVQEMMQSLEDVYNENNLEDRRAVILENADQIKLQAKSMWKEIKESYMN